MTNKVVRIIQNGAQFIVLLLILMSTQAWSTSEKRKIIIDCDAGFDDVLALTLALQYPGFEVLGITTTNNHPESDHATQVALRIVELSGQTIPVYKGAAKPLVVESTTLSGFSPLANTQHLKSSEQAQDIPAAQYLVETAHAYPGQITVVAIGRLTNLAQAIKQDPNFAKNIQQVILTGGSLYTPGNVSPVAEANMAGDPHAADIVFTAPWLVTMVGLDVINKVNIDDKMLTRVKARNQRFGEYVYALTRNYADFQQQPLSVGRFFAQDPAAFVYLIEPALFQLKQGPVRVVLDGIAIGQTIMAANDAQYAMPAWKNQPMVTAAIGVDKIRFERNLETLLLGEWPPLTDMRRSKAK
ncbi:nucleoside hydrolase [Paraglaciecola hydrolytica]|uniref:Inosine/uridine-preferring nucleoside hydrolase domain-containing protein n=1 Tax=Paraglaciecola hydrolytica TaxID=1799789 RepID=A0A136A691_9ALTE|nr:nucleoside hydrolase [Paraglaciecola hydrolytica]KXI30743.1 hypothetical protein AX660_04800 [Paraglaciecola hydrolytica]